MSHQTISDYAQNIFNEIAKKSMTQQEKDEEEKHQQYLDELYSAVNSLNDKIKDNEEMIPDDEKCQDNNCHCHQCDMARSEDQKTDSDSTTIVYIRCEHIPDQYKHDPYGMAFFIGNRQVVTLCKLCTEALSYTILQSFVREIMPKQTYLQRRGFR